MKYILLSLDGDDVLKVESRGLRVQATQQLLQAFLDAAGEPDRLVQVTAELKALRERLGVATGKVS